jgi:hypothetical protein
MPVHRDEDRELEDPWGFEKLGSCQVPDEGFEPGEAYFLGFLSELGLRGEKCVAEYADQVAGEENSCSMAPAAELGAGRTGTAE